MLNQRMLRLGTATFLSIVLHSGGAVGQTTQPDDRGGSSQDAREMDARGARPSRDGERGNRQAQQARLARLTLEQLQVAWAWQAKGVSRTAQLDATQTAGVIEVYRSVRTEQWKLLDEARKMNQGQRPGREGERGQRGGRGAGDGAGGQQGAGRPVAFFIDDEGAKDGGTSTLAGPEVENGQQNPGDRLMNPGFGSNPTREALEARVAEDRALLKTSLEAIVPDHKLERVYLPLSSFNPNWDRMVHGTVTVQLPEDAQWAVLGIFEQFVASAPQGLQGLDRQDREAMQKLRAERQKQQEKMIAELKAVLTDEQYTALEQAAGLRNRNARQGEGRGGDMAGRLQQMFERLDANGDGLIQKGEAPERLQARFDDLDENGDGGISAEELGRAFSNLRGNRGDGNRRGGFRGNRGNRGGGLDL